jgi:hypothetical protein
MFEPRTLQERIELLKEFKDVFGEVITINNSEIFNMIPLDQILTDEFENEFLKYMFSNSKEGLVNLFSDSYAYNKLRKRDDYKALEYRDKLIEKLFNLAFQKRFIDRDDLANMNIISDNMLYVLTKVLQENLLGEIFPLSAGRGYYYKTLGESLIGSLDSFLIKCDNFDLIEKAYTGFSKYYPEYVNYPLIIINEALTSEQKISIIKQTYIQKDITKYMSFIKKNIVNLNHLDEFIEATITQNNRVREKEARTLEIFRRVFFGMRSDYSEINLLKYENFDKLRIKYKPLFTSQAIRSFQSLADNYTITENISKFLYELFKNDEFEIKMEKAMSFPDLGKKFIQNISHTYNEIKGDKGKEQMLFKYAVEIMSISNLLDNFPETIMIMHKYPDIFKNIIKKELDVMKIYNSWRLDDELEKILRITRQFKSKELIDLIPFGGDIEKKSLFLASGRNSNPGENLAKFLKCVKEYRKLSVENPYFKDFLYNKVFEYYADDENTNSFVLQETSEVLKDDYRMKHLKSATGSNTDYDAIEKTVNQFILLSKELYPDKTDIVKNLEKVKVDLQVLISF